MTFLWNIISNDAVYVEMPRTLLGWLGWLALIAGMIIWAAKGWKALRAMKRRDWLWFTVLLVLTPFTALLLGFRLPSGQGLPPPGLPVVPQGPAMMLLLAVPWMIAGGVLGSIPATFLALISGTLLALFDTHSAYTPVIYALLGLLFSAMMQQRYRTRFYRLLRQPMVAMLLLPVGFAILFITAAATSGGDDLMARLDYGMTHVGINTLALAGMVLVGGIFGQIFRTAFPKVWGDDAPLIPSPTETSLENRLLVSIAPVIILLVLALLIGTWVMAGNASRKMLEDRLSSTANVAAESMPFFLEAGQNLILQLSDDATLASSSPDEIYTSLSIKLRSVPYFRQLYYLNQYGNPVSGYPEKNFEELTPSLEERTGIDLALKKVLVQTYTVPPQAGEGNQAAQISFIAAVQDDAGNIQGVLLGRSDLGANPFTQPVIQAIRTIQSLGGQGLIVDENGKILFHTQPDLVMTQYEGDLPETAAFYDGTAADGTREMVYAQPVVGRSWTIILTVPARMIQKQSYDIAVPLSGLILLLSLLTVIILRVGLRPVTASMRSLAVEAARIADGQLDHPLPVQGADEVGQLRQAFEQMRVRLKDRLEEINLLLEVSQGVASSLDLETSVQPILKAALNNGASVARMVLPPEPSAEFQSDMPDRVGAGAASEMYAGLDEPLLEISRQHSHIILTNLRRGR
ncbi:MAG: HAMP domain-containing protein, partial [Anaerolineaceae bacterium]